MNDDNSMDDSGLIGPAEPQVEAVELLEAQGGMPYDELKGQMGRSQEEMQELMQCLNLNKLVKRTFDNQKNRILEATPNERINPHTTDDDEYRALEHLMKARKHAQKAEDLFEDDSRGESVANNTRRWAEKSVSVAEYYLEENSE